jgi:hypothetical protein
MMGAKNTLRMQSRVEALGILQEKLMNFGGRHVSSLL